MLSDEQALIAEAVVSSPGNNLTVALPGSGKSTTCVAGIVKLLNEDPSARPWMVTFTKAATMSINNKLKLILSARDFERVGVSTFHSIIGEQYKQLPTAQEIILGVKQTNIIMQAMEQSLYVGKQEEASSLIDCETRSMTLNEKHYSKVTKAYLSLLKKRGLVDYNMVCREVVFALRMGKIRRLNISHLIVDEFQDTDEVQLAWMEEHAIRGVKITAVGDDDQSIYSFRGGLGFHIMNQYIERFGAQLYYLSSCYRCGSMILKAAERIITTNQQRITKSMRAAASHEGQVIIKHAPGRAESYEELSKSIASTKGSWAVLARSGFYLDKVEIALNDKNIACRRIGGRSIWDTPVADSILRLLKITLHQRTDRSSHYALSYLLRMDEGEIADFEEQSSFHLAEPVLSMPPGEPKDLMVAVLSMGNETNDTAKIFAHIANLRTHLSALRLPKREAIISQLLLDNLEDRQGSWHQRLNHFVTRLEQVRAPQELKLEPTVVVLTTLHGAKGLEWDNVAIIDVNKGNIPSDKSDTEQGIEEERRLMYVGMTRAINRLELYTHGQGSIYLDELMLDQTLTIDWQRYQPPTE